MIVVSEYRRSLAFKAGAKAAREMKPKGVCNREQGTIYYDDWHDGYNEVENARIFGAKP